MPYNPSLVLVREGKKLLPINTSDIIWIAAAGNYVRIHTAAASYLARGSLGSLLETLGEQQFVQIHKSAVININAMVELHPWFSGQMRVVLKTDVTLTISRKYKAALQERIRFLT